MAKTLVITGAGRGIGFELTRLFARAGYSVVAGVRDPTAGASLLAHCPPGSVQVIPLDVVDAVSVNGLREHLRGRAVDILINNAGVIGGDRQSRADMDYEAWGHAFEVNTMAPFRLTTALLPNLEMARGAKVITLSSQMASLSRRSVGQFAYRSSKAAVNKVMQVMAVELESRGVIVCPVHPGWARTDMGGPGADISVEESANGLFRVIEGLTMAESGRFWTWEGKEHAW